MKQRLRPQLMPMPVQFRVFFDCFEARASLAVIETGTQTIRYQPGPSVSVIGFYKGLDHHPARRITADMPTHSIGYQQHLAPVSYRDHLAQSGRNRPPDIPAYRESAVRRIVLLIGS